VNKKLLLIPLALLLALSLIAIGCPSTPTATQPTTTTPTKTTTPPPPPTKDKIVIGAARPLSGANAAIGDAAFGPIMAMFQEEVNADGGIYLEDYGKKLPIEYIIYDDTTDVGTMVRLTEKLIVEDKVDILFPSCGTAFISAQSPIANKYNYVLTTAEGGATTMTDALAGMPYVFVSLPYSDNYQLPVLAKMLAEKGAETAYIVYIADLHGIEYNGVASTEFGKMGIDIIASVGVPITQEDFSVIVKDAKAKDPDVFCLFAYPPIILPSIAESMALGFNPPAIVAGPAGNFTWFKFSFGEDVNVVNGITVFAAANEKTSPAFAKLFSDLEAIVGPAQLDYWGQPYYRAIAQIWKNALETTGTLDQDVLRDYIATTHFDTILGETYFNIFGTGGGLMAKESHPGEIGQWQNGSCEIVGGGDWPNTVLTGEWIYPKPEWP